MTSADLLAAFGPVLDKLRGLADSDPDFRAQLRDLGRVLQQLGEDQAQADGRLADGRLADGRLAAVPTSQAPTTVPVPALPKEIPPSIAFPKLNGPPPAVETPPPPAIPAAPTWQADQVSDEELVFVEKRCRLKAEGARWAATRQRRIREGADYHTDIEPQDRDIIARAKALPECFLWMCHVDSPTPEDLALFENLAECFEGAAASLAILHTILQENEEDAEAFEKALDLAAEAQSAVRSAIEAMDGPRDKDQQKIFFWLRRIAFESQILIQRFMRLDDPADSGNWADLKARIHELDERIQRYKNREKFQRSQFNRMRYHCKRIREHGSEDHDHDWRRVMESTVEVVKSGLPPSNPELRELLMPFIDDMPEGLEAPKEFALVLREIDRFLASRPSKPDQAAAVPAFTADVYKAAELLRGRAMVMIGGERRPPAHDALVAAFGLSELLWIETREHQSHVAFEPLVARPDVALVLLAIRWSSHGFGEVKDFCEKYGKPLIRLPAGYNPNQVAHHILTQVGERLQTAG